jgi:pheromone a factor receptor
MQVSSSPSQHVKQYTKTTIVLLSYRLYRYRREFVRLVAARNTTKSRFIRLFIICIIVVLGWVPYTIWLLASMSKAIVDPYSWSRVHDPERFNSILKVPSYGVVTIDKWGQVATGYVVFLVFGTGSDAYNMYKKMLVAIGLGRIFPGLYDLRESRVATPNSFINARTWTNSVTSKARSMFWSRSDSVTSTFQGSTRNDSIAMASMQRLGSAASHGPIVAKHEQPSWFASIFGRRQDQVLPLFSFDRSRNVTEITNVDTQKPDVRDQSPGVSAHAWATDKGGSSYIRECDGVRVFREVRLECQELDGKETPRKSDDDWA